MAPLRRNAVFRAFTHRCGPQRARLWSKLRYTQEFRLNESCVIYLGRLVEVVIPVDGILRTLARFGEIRRFTQDFVSSTRNLGGIQGVFSGQALRGGRPPISIPSRGVHRHIGGTVSCVPLAACCQCSSRRRRSKTLAGKPPMPHGGPRNGDAPLRGVGVGNRSAPRYTAVLRLKSEGALKWPNLR